LLRTIRGPRASGGFGSRTSSTFSTSAGDRDQSLLSTRGPDWWTDVYTLSRGQKSLLTVFGAEHSQDGIHAYGGIPQTTAEGPALLGLVQRTTTAYLRSALGVDSARSTWTVTSPPTGSTDARCRLSFRGLDFKRLRYVMLGL
jgi:hypothetical protein